ncbi:MAG: hypothetical protein NG712_03270 [Omnitrophica bacterium]|nr:hypothetical protein [Candidatus Omnitrophota bacterium]
MKFGRIILAGFVVGILNAVWGSLTCGKFFSWVYRLEPIFVWKSLENMSLLLANLAGIIFSIMLALVYALIHKGLPGKGLLKGLAFGFFVWIVGTLPGNFALSFFTRINHTVIIYWIVGGLVIDLLRGLVIAAIYKD